ncbi:hypothetical protein RV15_GL000137 [Enterococcus silesiacus]|uniref:HTH-type transcriptional regulator Rgg C-terminal domain-containing protein n=1 Tax=Enterococcus silesiacus TaxID=332949 RepID=A0AA91GK30_9ENTE|nr:hypothetical protein RV15_GL000137 [Enterococcus silesiacus]
MKRILNSLSLLPEEVFTIAPLNEDQQKFHILFSNCAEDLRGENRKEELINYYLELSNKNKDLRELSNYFAIKSYFAQLWDEVDEVSEDELNDIFTMVVNKDYYQHYDYIIIRNAMRILEKEKADILIEKIFLTKKNKSQAKVMDDAFYYILLNATTTRIYEKEYTSARKYIHLAKMQDKERKNFNYRIHLKYLENLLDYITIGDYQYMQRIQEYIHLLKDIGDTVVADQISTDVKLVLADTAAYTDKKDFPVIFVKHT